MKDSTINTFGSECFNTKENAHHNRMENVDCGFNDEPSTFQGSNVEFRGDHNSIIGSRIYQSRSWNLKLASDSATYDRGGNTAQGTTFSGDATHPIINRQTGSGPLCGTPSPPARSVIPARTASAAPPPAPGRTTPTVRPGRRRPVPRGRGRRRRHRDLLRGRHRRQRTSFTLKPGTATSTAANVGATVSYNPAARVATLIPSADLAANTQYTATLTAGIRSAVGTPWRTPPGPSRPSPPRTPPRRR